MLVEKGFVVCMLFNICIYIYTHISLFHVVIVHIYTHICA